MRCVNCKRASSENSNDMARLGYIGCKVNSGKYWSWRHDHECPDFVQQESEKAKTIDEWFKKEIGE